MPEFSDAQKKLIAARRLVRFADDALPLLDDLIFALRIIHGTVQQSGFSTDTYRISDARLFIGPYSDQFYGVTRGWSYV